MSGAKKPGCLARLIAGLAGLFLTLTFAALFYGTMVYQLAGEETPAAPEAGTGLLALGTGTLLEERTEEALPGGGQGRVVTREYRLEDGTRALAVTATPAAYIERLSREGWQPQLVTGFSLAGLDAVYELKDGRSLLAARSGDTVYMIEADVSEETIYALGAGASLDAP